jgi:tetrapyrrole methylase family protein/MazG family protein
LWKENLDNFDALRNIVAILRGPGGCPWDRKQTHNSLKPYLLEECYEALEALDESDSQKLCEELGDIMLQIVLHAQIAAEVDEFQIEDVIRSINAKLLHRHPHVFGNAKVKDAKEVAVNWEALKMEERQEEASLLSDIPKQMPSLARSQSIQRRVAQVGFDWEDVDGVIEKLTEEVEELKQADNHESMVEEFGDLLFTLANVARRWDINLEDALRLANQKFCRRFNYMEELCRKRGLSLGEMSLEEQNALWEEAKHQVEE